MINQTVITIAAANIGKDVRGIGLPFRYFRFIDHPVGAVVTMSTIQTGNKSSFITLDIGDVLLFETEVSECFFKSTVAGPIEFQWSLTDQFRTANINNVTVAPGVTILAPLNTVGEV